MPKLPYNYEVAPPIPDLEIALGLPQATETVGPFRAIVDSGADAALIPIAMLKQLGAQAWDEVMLRGPWGERRRIYTYIVDVHIYGRVFPGIEVVGDTLGETIVLGRTLLNKLILLLDGPDTTLYILKQRPRHLEL
jgi:hypothetical protein